MTTTTTAATDPGLDLAAVTRRYFAAWEARDPDRIAALHSDDSRFVNHATGEQASGRAAVRDAFAGIFAVFPDFAFEEHRTIFGPRHWLLDWTLLSGGHRLHCFDLVEVGDTGLVTNKETYVDVADFEAMVAAATGGEPRPSVAQTFVDRFTHAWSQRDAALLGALFRPDATVRQPTVGHRFTGAEVPGYIEQILAALPGLELRVRNWAANGPDVFIEWTITATAPEGGPVTTHGVDRFTLDGDLAVDEAVYFDTLPLWARLDPTMARPDLVHLEPPAGADR